MEQERPPLMGSWSRWYALLIGTLVIQIVLYYWITASFS